MGKIGANLLALIWKIHNIPEIVQISFAVLRQNLAFFVSLMRKILSHALVFLFGTWALIVAHALFAADAAVVQFEIIAPPTARIDEAIDITIRAVDKDNKVVTGYRGSIIFVPLNFGDVVPMRWKSISFDAVDNGEKKFSKGVIFKSSGKQTISVVDVLDDISGEATVNVEAAVAATGSALEEIVIITPAAGSKVTSEVVVVSGKSRKNSKLNVTLNGKDMGSILSDESGVFTKSLTGITQDTNILSVTLVDGAGTVIGKSADINFEKVTGGPAFYNATIAPGTAIESGDEIVITVEAEKWLSEVTLMIDGNALVATEESEGKYVVKTPAPAAGGEYKVTATIKNALGQELVQENALSFTVTEKVVSFDNLKVTTEGSKVVFNFGINNAPAELNAFKIAYGDSAESFSSEVATWNTGRIMKADGRFEWYVDKLAEKTYYFKILGTRADGTIISTIASDTVTATIWKASCSISNVGTIKIETLKEKSILSWDSITWALSYNIYKMNASGEPTLFQNTKETQYTIFLASGSVVVEDFGIKALCDEKTESADFSKASKVQTGPGLTAVLVVISGILGALILRRRSI